MAETAVVAGVLALSLFGNLGPPDATLDASWQEMLIHAHASGLQFGRDIIFTWGPWGFLNARTHLGNVEAVPILAWEAGGQFLVALALAVLTRTLVAWRRIAFVAAFIAFHWLFLDVVYFVLVALIGISGLMKRDASVTRLVGWTLVLGFLSQLKFTYLVISSAAVLAGAGCWIGRRSWSRAFAVAGGFGLAVVAAWSAAGQNPDNLYPYLRRSLEISSGYGAAMASDESWPVFIWGTLLALLWVLFLWKLWRTLPERALAAAAPAYLALSLYVMWKEAFTRADFIPLGGHVLGFFAYILILGPVVPGMLFPGCRWHWFDASFFLGLVGVACFDGAYYRLGPRVTWERLYGSVHSVARIGGLPEEWQAAYEKAATENALPAIRAAVGDGSVDVYDFNTGIAFLNRLKLDARPIFQGYTAYTPSLEGWNLRHYQSDSAPDFLLWNDERIDNRYPGQDDAMLLAALPGHYEPLFPEGGYWLFKKLTPVSGTPPARELVLERTVQLGEEVELPLRADRAVWLEARAVPNNLGRLRDILYKPAIINIATLDGQGRPSVSRLIPRVASEGFILAPTIAGGADMAALMREQPGSWVRSFHFEAPDGQDEFWSHVDVRLFTMPGLPIRSERPVDWLVAQGIFDRAALSVTSQFQQQVFDAPQRALLLHADGEIVFEIPTGANRFTTGYGIRKEAYEGEAHTEGVEFSVDVVWTSGRRVRLWRRFLDPVARPGDRGTQELQLDLPADLPMRLIFHTGLGPRRDGRWDWSYVSGLHFGVDARR